MELSVNPFLVMTIEMEFLEDSQSLFFTIRFHQVAR